MSNEDIRDNDEQSIEQQAPTYRIGVILSGDILDETGFLKIISGCDFLVCADGGVRHLRPYGILPDLLTGDLDSIKSDDRRWIEQAQIPVNQYSPEKDFTDSELAVDSALRLLETELVEQGLSRPANRSISICLLAATGSRPDHVLGNQLMAANLARSQFEVMLSDGSSWFYLMNGPESRVYDSSAYPEDCAVSVIALSEQVRGITYKGLKYPLDNYDLPFGSQRGISNSIDCRNAGQFEISISSGTLMVIITKAD